MQLVEAAAWMKFLKREQGICAEVNSANGPSLAWDKKLVGTLDSACNRTCTGTTWLANYLKTLCGVPQEIQDLVCYEAESKLLGLGMGTFRKVWKDGGCQP